MAEWQPIETAPRDGTRVRLLIPYDPALFTEDECADEGQWDESAYYPGIGDNPPEHGCWRFDGDDGPFDLEPTHWMPLLEELEARRG